MGWGRSIRKDRGSSGFVGCMSGMLQLFDFHQLAAFDRATISSSSSCFSLPSTIPDQGSFFCTGIEAPRNSLEVLPCRNAKADALQHHDEYDEDDDGHIPMAFETFTGPKTRKNRKELNAKAKNPSVVARLMGLDILPDEIGRERERDYFAVNSVNTSSKTHGMIKVKLSHPTETTPNTEPNLMLRALKKRSDNINQQEPPAIFCRSLPESPRISSGRRSDVEHRLSLQIQKENLPPFININYVDTSSFISSTPSSTPSSYLRNLDAKKTNYSSSNCSKPTSPRLALSSNSPRLSKTKEEKGDPNKHTTPSCSPRLRCKTDDTATALTATTTTKPTLQSQSNLSSPRFSQMTRQSSNAPEPTAESGSRPTKGPRLSPTTNKPKPKLDVRVVGDVSSRVPKKDSPPKIRESYVKVQDVKSSPIKKGQKPICDTLVIKSHSVISTTKESSTRLPRTPASGASPPHKSQATAERGVDDIIHDGPAKVIDFKDDSLSPKKPTLSSLLEKEKGNEKEKGILFVYSFIEAILESMGVRSGTKVSFTNWYSPSHPLDPIIFTQLYDASIHNHHDHHDRHHHHSCMSDTRSNRKLVFELVDELLRERLRSHLSMKPWMMMMHGSTTVNGMMIMTGKKLLHDVWMDVNVFPPADCKIVQDVDAIVVNDLSTNHHSSPINESCFLSFSETIMFRIGWDITDSLIAEAVVDMLAL